MDSFSRAGLVFDVRDAGPAEGVPVVLLHGFPQDGTAWDRMAPRLHAAGYRTLAPDQRGYSPRARPEGRRAYRLRELVDDVRALLDATGVDRAAVVGHDWGAVVSWALAAWHPDRVRTLTALSVPHPAAFTAALTHSTQALQSTYIGLFQLPVLPERFLLAGGGHRLRAALTGMGLPAASADHYVRRMREPGALTAALDWYRALAFGATDTVGRVEVPTLHLWSTGDRALNRAGADATGRFVSGPYEFQALQGVPHWIPEVAAGPTAQLLLAHLRAHP